MMTESAFEGSPHREGAGRRAADAGSSSVTAAVRVAASASRRANHARSQRVSREARAAWE